MGNQKHRLVRSATDDCHQVVKLDDAETGEILPPDLRLYREAERGNSLLVPVRGLDRLGRARNT